MEGIVYSLLSLGILLVVIYPLLAFLQPYLNDFFKEYSVSLIGLVNQNFLQVFGTQLLVAAVITVLSSYLAVRRYIKV
ncbi:MAG: hypothetical protein A2927_00845 [Candidatus Komeilibacteria bacterium RIFCSPLOWO2_01_FULL_45_10]|uniref:Uncharacterized protein n=1 Tax=Candidatus Komeilibacteria bacterium RIFCSPLOWO2_01_FULL_45_10 TaxID=1798550 RepID=A0A1G2BK24_9BACT|nr:MAG: hypothetical protein A2927_00845 [Candidatus Komeilibacteria bacterium RIFCSPLOWO2_01_FULL_45_10]